MPDAPNEALRNPFYHALLTEQARFAIGTPAALRYPSDILPFAGLPAFNRTNLEALRDLMSPGEIIYAAGENPAAIEGLEYLRAVPCWQMHYEAPIPPETDSPLIIPLSIQELFAEDAPAMVALTDVAFPGYFRPRTHLLGRYFGIHVEGQLIAMAGERTALPGFREISAVCTHPAHTGRGYAARLMRHLMRLHARAGLRSFLHVLKTNTRAISLYQHMGYHITHTVPLHALRRP